MRISKILSAAAILSASFTTSTFSQIVQPGPSGTGGNQMLTSGGNATSAAYSNLVTAATAATARSALGLDVGNSPTFVGLTLSGMTQGSVPFFGAGGAVLQDNANFFWDNSGKFLGVNDNSPISAITVNNGNILIRSNTTTAAVLLTAVNGNYGSISAVNNTNTATRNLVINQFGGNVGIGATNPQALLQIGTTAATCRSYNLFTSPTVGEWAYCGDWGKTPNVVTYGSDFNGTGNVRNLQFVVGGVVKQDYGVTTAASWSFVDPVRLSAGYTVAGLPAAGTAGRRAFVTDQLTTCAAAGAALTGGGTLKCPVFDNGASWVGD